MDVNNLDHEKYSDITLYKMKDNNHGGELPFFVREYAIKNHDAPIIHRHEYMQINYVFRGKAQHMINNNVFDIYKGDIFIIPPYIPHRIIASEGQTVRKVRERTILGNIAGNYTTLCKLMV
jgi:mannose-6-phosphate isomerase-like protein (cupin superfamily)